MQLRLIRKKKIRGIRSWVKSLETLQTVLFQSLAERFVDRMGRLALQPHDRHFGGDNADAILEGSRADGDRAGADLDHAAAELDLARPVRLGKEAHIHAGRNAPHTVL